MLRFEGPHESASFGPEQSRILLGASSACSVRVAMPGVELEHCLVVAVDGGYAVRDLRTPAGTRLVRAGAALAVPVDHPTALQDGDVLVLGDDARVTAHIEDEPASIVATVRVAEVAALEDRATSDRELLQTLYAGLKALSVKAELDEVLDATVTCATSPSARACAVRRPTGRRCPSHARSSARSPSNAPRCSRPTPAPRWARARP